MTQWHDERDKGERDREITRWDEENRTDDGLKKGKGRFLPFLAKIFMALEDGKRKVLI